MKKQKAMGIGIAAALVLASMGCASRETENSETVTQESDSQTAVQETETERDRSEEYTERTSPERFDASYSVRLTGELTREEPPDVYCNTNEDGSLRLYLSEQDGTPYSAEGLIYDHDMFTLKTYVKSNQGSEDEAGSGSADFMYVLTPSDAGEAEIVTLSCYYGSDEPEYVGNIYHITVDENLRCSMDWYGRVSTEENLVILQDGEVFCGTE
jgi:protein involved in sex pheromone biosynthesis